MNWTVENVPDLKGYTVEWAEKGNFYLSKKNVIFHSENLKPPFKKIAQIDAPSWKSLAANFRLAQRLLRFQITNIIPLASGEIFITFDKTVGVIRNGKYQTLKGLARPCRVLRAACAVDEKGDVYFGEYLFNAERGEMRIYRYKSGSNTLEIAHTFKAGEIRHVHGIYSDEFTKTLFCLAGDIGDECRIVKSNDGFRTMETIGKGDETWRAVSILFDEENYFYGMDAELQKNLIYKVNRKTLARKPLGETSGTVFYSKKIGGDLFFTTTAENAPSQTENVAALWHVGENDDLKMLASFKKDFFHPTLFQFGTIHFPYFSNLENELYFHLVGVKEDNRVFKISRK